MRVIIGSLIFVGACYLRGRRIHHLSEIFKLNLHTRPAYLTQYAHDIELHYLVDTNNITFYQT